MKFILAFIFSILIHPLYAELIPTITPTIGFDQTTSLLPETHTQQNLYYGVTVRMGWQIIGLKASYLRSDYSKTFSSGAKNATTTQKARVGLSSMFGFSLVNFEAGAGVEARILQTKITAIDGTETSSDNSKNPTIDPYAQAGVVFRLGSQFSLNALYTITFIDKQNLLLLQNQRPEYSVGFNVSFHI